MECGWNFCVDLSSPQSEVCNSPFCWWYSRSQSNKGMSRVHCIRQKIDHEVHAFVRYSPLILIRKRDWRLLVYICFLCHNYQLFLQVIHSSKLDPQSVFRQATFFLAMDKDSNLFFTPYCAVRIGVHIIVLDLPPIHLSRRVVGTPRRLNCTIASARTNLKMSVIVICQTKLETPLEISSK